MAVSLQMFRQADFKAKMESMHKDLQVGFAIKQSENDHINVQLKEASSANRALFYQHETLNTEFAEQKTHVDKLVSELAAANTEDQSLANSLGHARTGHAIALGLASTRATAAETAARTIADELRESRNLPEQRNVNVHKSEMAASAKYDADVARLTSELHEARRHPPEATPAQNARCPHCPAKGACVSKLSPAHSFELSCVGFRVASRDLGSLVRRGLRLSPAPSHGSRDSGSLVRRGLRLGPAPSHR